MLRFLTQACEINDKTRVATRRFVDSQFDGLELACDRRRLEPCTEVEDSWIASPTDVPLQQVSKTLFVWYIDVYIY